MEMYALHQPEAARTGIGVCCTESPCAPSTQNVSILTSQQRYILSNGLCSGRSHINDKTTGTIL